jgi:hypothetical protein
MRFLDGPDSSTLTSAHPKSGQLAVPVASGLIIGTLVSLGLVVSFGVVWACYWRRSARLTTDQWWVWLGWALVVVVCVDASLWAVSFLGIGALGWVVPTLATFVSALFIFWLQQGGRPKKEATTAMADSPKQLNRGIVSEVPAKPALLIPNDLLERADIDRDTLAEVFQILTVLKPNMSELRRRMETALAAYKPGEDWRILLGIPRQKLDSCLNLIEQLNGLPRRWVYTGKWSLAFWNTVAAANDEGIKLRTAMKDRASGRSERGDLSGIAKRLEDLVCQLDSLARSAAIPP